MATTNYVKVDGAWIESSTFGATDAQVLLITSAQLTADSANQTALAASQLAGSASSAVSTAVTNASNANAAIIDISSDGKLTPLEKSVVRKDWDMISGEKSVLDSQADNYSITTEKTTYDVAWQSLATYLNSGSTWSAGIPYWINDTNILLTTTVTKATMRSTFATYFNAKIALLKKVSDEAKRIADAAKQAAIDADAKAVTAAGTAVWSGVSGTGRPADGATRNVHQGVYSGSSAYLVGDMVTSSSGEGWSCYVATSAYSNNAPPTSSSTTYNTWWKLMSGGGVTASLSKDTIAIASDSTGYVSNFTGIPTVTMSIYIGGSDDSANWTCACTYSNCNTPEASSNKSQTISSFQTAFDNGSITFTASKTGFSNVIKILSVTKSKSGSAGSPSTVPGLNGDTTIRVFGVIAVAAIGEPSIPSSGTSNPPAAGTSPAITWYTTTQTVSLGNKQYQCDGIKNGITANIVWGQPYLSVFKVDTLDAFTVKTGSLLSTTTNSASSLTINCLGETSGVPSNEFRCYSSGKVLASMGDMGAKGGFEPIFLSAPFFAKNLTAATWKTGYHVQLSRFTDADFSMGGAQSAFSMRTTNRLLTTFPYSGELGIDIGTISRTTAGTIAVPDTSSMFVGASSIASTDVIGVNFGYRDHLNSSNNYAAILKLGATRVTMCATISTIRFAMYAEGNIGTDSNISASGNITASGNVTAYYGSDERIKENIQRISDPIRKISMISGNTFKWKDDYYHEQDIKLFKKYDVGVIAQEIQVVLPEAVHERENGILAVDYKKIIPLLIEGFNAQQKQIEELRNDVARLS